MRIQKKENTLALGFIKFILLVAPFIVGWLGFLLEGFNNQDAAYSSFQLYFANIPATSENEVYNVLVEIGRWTAPVVAVAIGISLIVELVNGELWPIIWSKLPGKYMVYGDSEVIGMLCPDSSNPFSRYCIVKENRYVRCKKYVLLFNQDKDNLDFYSRILLPKISDNEDVQVYMKVQDLAQQDLQDSKITSFQIDDYIASSFYKNKKWIDYMYSFAENSEPVRIAIIGFGILGIHMLETGVSLNLVSTKQKVEYHIWGDTDEYRAMHSWMTGNEIVPDRIVFHDKRWYSEMPIIEDMNCIILCDEQTENIHVLSDLLRLTNVSGRGTRIYVFTDNEDTLKLFQIKHFSVSIAKGEKENSFIVGEDNQLSAFGFPHDGHFLEHILSNDEDISREAKCKHERYVNEQSKKNQERTYFGWEKLNAFTRWDNIMSASLDDTRKYLIDKYAISKEESAELEHIRWVRSHYINGWTFSENRNDALKKHPQMKEFYMLSDEEKEKDDNIRGT